jgi:hypothetical protein
MGYSFTCSVMAFAKSPDRNQAIILAHNISDYQGRNKPNPPFTFATFTYSDGRNAKYPIDMVARGGNVCLVGRLEPQLDKLRFGTRLPDNGVLHFTPNFFQISSRVQPPSS